MNVLSITTTLFRKFHRRLTKKAITKGIQQAIIISGFTCVGKSTLAQNSSLEGYSVVDLDSSKFSHLANKQKNPNFKQHYRDAILQAAGSKAIILISTHSEIRDELQSLGVHFSLVMPRRHLKNEWLQPVNM
ncbi:hypothetical protein F5B17DRAFT_453377 [Nemania serpens]|nr:hypothetical protein F5B17DRAFT_453377 [Nemania serpens]